MSIEINDYLIAEDIVLKSGLCYDDVPEECMSLKERYENAVRKSCLFSKLMKTELQEITGIEDFEWVLC